MRRFKCPMCGSSLRKRRGKYGPFLGCKSYPECSFALNISGEMEDDDIQRAIRDRTLIWEFLIHKHNPMNCDKCHGEKEASSFYNSLYHFMDKRGFLTEKQREAIIGRVRAFHTEDQNEAYIYPPLDDPTPQEEALLRRQGLW